MTLELEGLSEIHGLFASLVGDGGKGVTVQRLAGHEKTDGVD